MNFIKRYFLLICINLLFISCDFDEIEPFEMPAWNWPLSFPLLDEEYTFAEMGVALGDDGLYYNASGDVVDSSNNIFFDEIDNTLFIEFSANLLGADGSKVGVDDTSLFEIPAPPFDSNLGSINIPAFSIEPYSIDAPIPLSLGIFLYQDHIPAEQATWIAGCNFLPSDINLVEGFSKDSTFSNQIFSVEEINESIEGGNPQFTSIDKITFDEGSVVITITNNYPFKVDATEIIFTSNGEQLFSDDFNENTFKFNDILPGQTVEQIYTISSENTVDFGNSLDFQFNFFVDDLSGTGESSPYGDSDFCRMVTGPNGWYLCEEPAIEGSCEDENGEQFNPWLETIFDVQVDFNITNAKSITGQLEIDPIIQEVLIQMPQSDVIDFDIVGGHIIDYIVAGKNTLNLDIENNMFAPITFNMEFPNFTDINYDKLSVNTLISIGDSYISEIQFHDYYLAHSSTPGDPIDNIIVTTSIEIDASDNIEFMLDGGYELRINDISFSDIELEYITAADINISFDTPSINIDNIPSGFAGFEFNDLSLEFNVFNQIGIPVNLQLELTGNKTETDESVSIIIDPQLSYNIVVDENEVILNENADLQNAAYTRIVLDKFGQTTYQYVLQEGGENENLDDYILFESDDPDFENPKFVPKDDTILDIMTIAPDELLVSGGAEINGTGVLAPNTYVWGDFTMIAPLSFVFAKDIQFIPAEPTVLAAMDESTRNKIDSSLVVAKLNLDITNSIPIAGNIGLLVSDYNSSLCVDPLKETCLENYFPVYFDLLETNPLGNQNISQEYLEIFVKDKAFLEDDLLITGDIQVISENNETLYINFLDSEMKVVFFIGRIFNLEIEAPYEIDSQTGFSVDPSNYMNEIELDTTRIDWITSETDLYMMPMITFDNTDDFYCEDGSECIDGYCDIDNQIECLREPRTFQTTNSMDINSFITFTLNTGALFERNKNNSELNNKKEVLNK